MKYEVPSGDLHQLGIPSGDSFYSKLKYEVPSGDLLWPISKYEIPSGDLKQLGIPSGDSFYSIWNMRSLLATSFNQYRNTRSLLAISTNLESHLAIPFFEAEIMRSLLAIFFNQKPKNLFCKSVNLESHLVIPFNRLLDVVPPDGRVWKLLSSLLVVLESTQWFFLHLQFRWNALRSSPVMIQKTYMQWFMIRCHACICTWFWNIGPIIFFYFMKLFLDMSLLLKSYAGFISRAAYHIFEKKSLTFFK